MKILMGCALGAAMMIAAPSIAAPRAADVPARQDHSTHAPVKKPAPAKKAAPKSPYGQWNRSWGAQPPAPPKQFARKSDWYRHVRACQQKYRSYNARTDTYRTRAGKSRRCAV
ncbi:BA14K family protein [Sphingopyxis chilensis]|uniref:BA14K family protein n=1 Tax=Sphingopyxis chilensis TaxID=180400 RepID=UPI002DDCC2C3|nr:BA14K family protein [Sphingopyxis chilensis]